MGTHPIFESDFDCLTDNVKMGQNQAKSQYASVDMVENDDNNNDTDNANDLTFVFHNDDGLDSNERVVHDQIDQKQRDPSDEPGWTIYQMQPGGILVTDLYDPLGQRKP